MNRLLKFLIAASALPVWIVLPSCAPKIDPDTSLQQEVSEVQQRTLPPDSRFVNRHPLTHQWSGASASWEFDSNYAPDAYNRWVTSRLQADFQVRETANSSLRFSKFAQGDVETLSVETALSSATLHVTIKLEIYPD